MEGGADPASAFARRLEVFPPGYVALVDAGLKSGDLAGTLLIFAEEARFTVRMRDDLRSAVLYPLLVAFAATLFLSYAGWVLPPEFAKTFDDMLDGAVAAPVDSPVRHREDAIPRCRRWA